MNLKSLLPQKTKKEILKTLKRKKFENIDAIKTIEKFFIKKRNYVFKMPPPSTPVILLLSGGLDSTISWAILTKIYGLIVYPLVRISPESGNELRKTKKTLKFFSKFFKKEFPNLFRKPFFFKDISLIPEIHKKYLTNLRTDKNKLFNFITSNNEFLTEIPDFMSRFISPALQYRNLIYIREKKKINTVFLGLVASDGDAVKAQTFTSLRSMMFNACNTTQDYKLQISSIAIEKELGHFLAGKDLVKIGSKLEFPIEKTWSCQKNGSRYHCGKCPNCGNRKYKFSNAGVDDKTIYLSNYKSSLIFFYYKKYFQPYFPLLHKALKYAYNKIIH